MELAEDAGSDLRTVELAAVGEYRAHSGFRHQEVRRKGVGSDLSQLVPVAGAVLAGYRIVITEHVRREILLDEQTTALDQAIEAGNIDEVELTEPEGQRLFAELKQVLGRGESALHEKGGLVCCDTRTYNSISPYITTLRG